MTYNDIYTKFMIEYDKANITSSYPSLTDYEIATLLDKAYLAIIAQKLTGNNQRRSTFESDTKAIEDLRPLIITRRIDQNDAVETIASNEYVYSLPTNLLYYIQSYISINSTIIIDDEIKDIEITSTDKKNHIRLNVLLVDHQIANKFKSTATNLPWVKTPVCYIEHQEIHYILDPFDKPANITEGAVEITYVIKPTKFVNSVRETEFELSDTMAEELINLAIVFATENVESPKLQTKLTTKTLES